MTRRTRSALVCAAIAALAVTAVAACGSSSKGGGGGTPKGGGTLTIQAGDSGNPTLVEDFNPFQASTTGLHGTFLLYEPLEFRSPIDGSFTPFVATGHKFTDPKTLVFTIRQGVKWSDGTDLTSADVLFTFNLLKKFPALDTNGIWAQVASVAASGNDFTVTFKAPNVPFAGVVAKTLIVPEHVWSSIPDPTKFTNNTPVGSGPFALDKFAPTQYSLKKNPSYWQAARIAPSEVLFPAPATNQNTNQLDVTSGKFDWSYTFLPNVQKTYVSRDPKHNMYWFPPGGVITLYLNLTKAPYSDANFRKGVSLALDRTTIAAKAVNGYLDAASQSGMILPNLKKWLDPSLSDQGVVKQDPTAAQAAFAQAGYTSQGGKLVGKNGKQATMSIVMPNNFSDWNNFERFKDPTVDQALGTLAAATDPGAQSQATYTLEHVMYDKVPVVLMYYGGSWGLFSTKNFTGWPSADNPYTLPTSYDNSLLLVVTHLTKS